MPEQAHGIDSTRFQKVANQLDRERVNAVRHQNSVFHGVLKHVPWATLDRLVEEHESGRDPRNLQARARLVAMLYAQLSGSRSLRDIETSLKSQAAKLYHVGGARVSKSALATANATRPCETFAGLLAALMKVIAARSAIACV